MPERFRIHRTRALLSCLMVGVFLLSPSLANAQKGYNPELQPYVEFLKHQTTSAKDYILDLFKTHDLVILCERDHRDITQYDLYLSIISDPRFIDSVGNVFTEVGTITQAPAVNAFVHAESLSADSVDRAVLRFQRDCSIYPVWANYNYSYFIRGLQTLNEKLPGLHKVNLFNSDVSFDWRTIDSAQLKEFWDDPLARDSIMASQIIQKFDEIREAPVDRHKALVILNYRHAFLHDVTKSKGGMASSAGRFLFERYPGRAANVYVNGVALVSARSDNDVTIAAVQDGRWDAAFKVGGVKDAGFDFDNSPFGRDSFDIYPTSTNRFQDEFDGFVFYLPLDEFKAVLGMPGFIDSTFGVELSRRFRLYSTLGGNWKSIPGVEAMKDDYNRQREFPAYESDSLNAQIQKWLKP
jgi:hypothetical protein